MRLAPLIPVAILATAAPLAAQPSPAVPPDLAPILERAGAYVLGYEDAFQNIAAQETSTQWMRMADERARGGRAAAGLRPGSSVKPVEGAVPPGGVAAVCVGSSREDGFGPSWCQRVTKADIVFVRVAGALPWGVFRDVYEVNDIAVRASEPRLERIFSATPPADAERQARGLLAASDERYSLGPALRNLDFPTLGMVFLHPGRQSRLAWKAAGKRRFGPVETVEIAFEEVARPTIVRQAGGDDLPARGRLWVDPARGTLLRSETEFRFEARRARASFATEFRQDATLAIWVPAETRAEYENTDDAQPAVFSAQAKTTAQYSRFRRFSTLTSDVSAAGAEDSRSPSSSYGAELLQLLQRAGEYVSDYERSFGGLLVEETYKQTVKPRMKLDRSGSLVLVTGSRTTRADLVFVRLAGEFPWASYRDVFEVDGQKVREHEERLVKLLSSPRADREEQARALLAASAAYNIGPVTRTVNLPTLPLVFLLPRNQQRFEFRLGERRTIASTEAVELLFRETSRPALVKGPHNADLPASGRFWVNDGRGTVVRTELDLDFGPEAEARVTTDYRPQPALAMWVPSEMREHYADRPGATVQTFPNTFSAVARYARFRRFTVTTEEQATVPKP